MKIRAVADKDKSQAQGGTQMNRMKRQFQGKGQQHGTDGFVKSLNPNNRDM